MNKCGNILKVYTKVNEETKELKKNIEPFKHSLYFKIIKSLDTKCHETNTNINFVINNLIQFQEKI